MKIKHALICILVTWSALPALAEESPDAVSSASMPAAESQGASLTFHFFGDFDLEAAAAGDFSGDPVATFKQNHQALLIRAAGNAELSILADVLHPEDLFEMGISFGPYRLTVGRILIPFGEFGFHHLYGGKPDEGGLFLPKLWSDFGFSWRIPVGSRTVVDVYAVNGFDPAGFTGGAELPRFYSSGEIDNNLAKAVGFRVRWNPATFARVSASAYHDFYADSPGQSITFAGADGGLKFGPAGLGGGFIFGMIRGPDLSEFYRWADYGEIRYDLTSSVALRLRLGSMDPDTRISNGEDQNNANLGLIWKYGPVEYNLVYYRNLSGNQFSSDPTVSDNHRLLFKILVTL